MYTVIYMVRTVYACVHFPISNVSMHLIGLFGSCFGLTYLYFVLRYVNYDSGSDEMILFCIC